MTAELLVLLAIGLPWLGAALVRPVSDAKPKLQHTLAVVFALAGAAAALALIPQRVDHNILSIPLGGAFGEFTFCGRRTGPVPCRGRHRHRRLAVILIGTYMWGEEQLGRYYAYVLFFIGAMVGLVLTSNLLLMLFGEITAPSLRTDLVPLRRPESGGRRHQGADHDAGGRHRPAGRRALLSPTRELRHPHIPGQRAGVPPAVLVMAFGFLAAAAAKSAQFPFQTWLPDAMEAPTPISALIHAATMVNAGVYLLARFYPAFAMCQAGEGGDARRADHGSDGGTDGAGSHRPEAGTGLFDREPVGLHGLCHRRGGVFASQFHLLSHAVFKALLFLAAGAVIHAVGTRDMRRWAAWESTCRW